MSERDCERWVRILEKDPTKEDVKVVKELIFKAVPAYKE